MQATALVCDEKQRFSLQSVTLPELRPDEILVRALASGVSVGTEFALIRNKISWGPYPLCTGYMAVGVVEKAGDAARSEGFAPGARVYYRGNAPMLADDGRDISSVSGTHCSHAVTTVRGTHAAALLPDGAPVEEASMFVLPAVGLAGVDMANPRLGAEVLVYGAGLIGLGVIAACAARGCRVSAVDIDAAARKRALAFGADFVLDPAVDDLEKHFKSIAPAADGADFTFESTGLAACLEPAMKATRTRGVFVWQGNYGAAPLPFPFLVPHGRLLTMHFPCDDGHAPARAAVIKNMMRGALPWAKAITHRIDCSEAPEVFERINQGDRAYAGVVIRWS